ncbi:MAG: hypothetical protein HY401_07240 [Elusimicrobia bacterium]|nr:hypothetical protein [Elusimicrobiota bacterium]
MTTVDSTGETGYNPSLVIDSTGHPHIAYTDWGDNTLRYARWNAGQWLIETVDDRRPTGGTPSLALDSSGNPHISYASYYSSGPTNDLWYAKKIAGIWSFESVDSAGNVGLWSSIKVAPDGKVHVSYQDTAPESQGGMNLKYALRSAAGQWMTDTVEFIGDVGQFSSLALNPVGAARIAYMDFTNKKLKYAKQNLNCSGDSCSWDWAPATVDTAGWSGFYASIAVDSAGTVHIAHQDALGQDLRYARKTSGGSWVASIVDSMGDVGEYASLTLDQDENPQIAYYDSTNARLKHARWNGASWDIQTIPGTTIESWNTSIGVDQYNNPHVAYLDWLKGDLKYARWSNAPLLEWTGEAGYVSDGLEPNEGNNFTKFIFRVKYSDPDNDPVLAGFPKLIVKKGGAEISGSPFSIGAYKTAGPAVFYEYPLWIGAGSDYTYAFEAKDRWGAPASGNPTALSSGPVVTGVDLPASGEEVFAYPNPARGEKITFRVSVGYLEPILELKIFDLAGRSVIEIADERFNKTAPPSYEYAWNMQDESGREVASGVYAYYLRARDQKTGQEFKAVRKFAILK